MNNTVSKITFLPPANEIWGKVMFSQVFVCPQGVSVPACITDDMTRWGVSVQGGLCPGRVSVQVGSMPGGGGLYPGEGVLCPVVSVQGGLYPGGLCQGGPHGRKPPYSNKRAARILLECISVYYIKVNKFSFRWNWISTLKSLCISRTVLSTEALTKDFLARKPQ